MLMMTGCRVRAVSRRCLFVFALCLVAAPTARAVDWKNPPQGEISDDWMLIELEGQKVGYGHIQMSREGDEIHTTNLMSLVLKRAGSSVPIKVLQTTTETVNGDVVEFSSRMDASAQAMHKQGRVEDGTVYVTSDQFGMQMKSQHPFPEGAVMSWGALRKQAQMGYAPGTKYAVQIYEPMFSESAGVTVETQIGDKEEIEVEGKKVPAIRTEQQMMGVSTTVWIDSDHEVLRTEMPLMGIPMVMTRSTREKALAEFSPPEFFMPTTIRSPRSIDRKNARAIEFVLRLKDRSVAMPKLPKTDMQTPSDVTSNSVHLTVKRLDHQALAQTPPQKYGADMQPYLAPNPVINCDDPAVQAMAKEAKGDAKTPYEVADNLRRYVTDVIKDKNLNVGFATASEVCRNKEGDCSEHAVLLAALGRACGLPARVVTGLVYVPVFGGSDDIFGFHMWTQFRLGDTWADFDAAQRESDCNPTHIAFSVTSLDGAGLGQIALDLVNVIGNLEIDVVRVDDGTAAAGG
ncbi:MAG TPA: transglutaminase family protein [Phycisphaerae bacterium]|nr:transglutaminase family protein [Phycisphaerales bacterium]HRX84063.1 transglutaminase family protein [Phycisphaerae bacterium]